MYFKSVNIGRTTGVRKTHDLNINNGARCFVVLAPGYSCC